MGAVLLILILGIQRFAELKFAMLRNIKILDRYSFSRLYSFYKNFILNDKKQ